MRCLTCGELTRYFDEEMKLCYLCFMKHNNHIKRQLEANEKERQYYVLKLKRVKTKESKKQIKKQLTKLGKQKIDLVLSIKR